MKMIKQILHVLGIIFIPGYWLAAIVVYVHHKIKNQPVSLIKEERKIQKDMIEKKDKVKRAINKKKEKIKEKVKKKTKSLRKIKKSFKKHITR